MLIINLHYYFRIQIYFIIILKKYHSYSYSNNQNKIQIIENYLKKRKATLEKRYFTGVNKIYRI